MGKKLIKLLGFEIKSDKQAINDNESTFVRHTFSKYNSRTLMPFIINIILFTESPLVIVPSFFLNTG